MAFLRQDFVWAAGGAPQELISCKMSDVLRPTRKHLTALAIYYIERRPERKNRPEVAQAMGPCGGYKAWRSDGNRATVCGDAITVATGAPVDTYKSPQERSRRRLSDTVKLMMVCDGNELEAEVKLVSSFAESI
jgi:hypothetical protein